MRPIRDDDITNSDEVITVRESPLVASDPVISPISHPVNNELIPSTSEQADHEVELEESFRKVIGERMVVDKTLAAAIHRDVAVRWEEIVKMGLPKQELDNTLKKYPPPINLTQIEPPRLNPEVKAALDINHIKRDQRIVEKQVKIGAALSALGKSVSITLKTNSEDSVAQFEATNNAARLVADLQREETEIRRSLIIKNIQLSLKDTLKESKPDEWLFGKDLGEQLKAAKSLQRSVNDLKPTSSKKQFGQPTASKNFRSPSQQNHYRFSNNQRGGQKRNPGNRRPYNQNRYQNPKQQFNQKKQTN